ncbi:MAG: flagellar hook-basal body complex protein FliE [Verrucomicrobia subdivision 3 bacterium]|nr:flagellar hook-basal body complex protein FliE [Verrucomicrobiota bacterium]MCC6822527.1 flagellar hook-basal body complex protein FliE [Limisphaerales bacterium]
MLRGAGAVGAPNLTPSAIPQYEFGQLAPANAVSPTGATAPNGATFANTLDHMVADVSGKQAAASDAITGLMSGQGVPLHQAMIAMEEASVSFQLMVEVRNKLLESYQELMRMQV